MHPFCGAIRSTYLPVQDIRGIVALIGIIMHLLASEPFGIQVLLCPSQYLYGTIMVTACLMAWDWWVFRAGSILLCWPKLFSPFLFPVISLQCPFF